MVTIRAYLLAIVTLCCTMANIGQEICIKSWEGGRAELGRAGSREAGNKYCMRHKTVRTILPFNKIISKNIVHILPSLSQFINTWSLWNWARGWPPLASPGLPPPWGEKDRDCVWIVKLCSNDKPVGLNIRNPLKWKSFLFEFESKLTFLILHKNALAYFNLVKILKFPNHISITLVHLCNLAE